MGLKALNKLTENAIQLQRKLSQGLFIQDILFENEAFIVNMNAEVQLYEQGINRLGVDIMDYQPYTEYTISIKKKKGQPTNRVTLHDEGDFAESIYLDVRDDYFEIKAADFKTEALIRKYGREILGLTHENILEIIWQYIYPAIKDKTKKQLYGTN